MEHAIEKFMARIRIDVTEPKLRFTDSNRMAIINYISNRAGLLRTWAGEAAADVVASLREKDKEMGDIYLLKERINDLEQQRELLEMQISELEKKADALKAQFSDERMRNAYVLWKEITKAEQGDNSYIAQKKITAAGAIISAALGMQCYFGIKSNQQEDEK